MGRRRGRRRRRPPWAATSRETAGACPCRLPCRRRLRPRRPSPRERRRRNSARCAPPGDRNGSARPRFRASSCGRTRSGSASRRTIRPVSTSPSPGSNARSSTCSIGPTSAVASRRSGDPDNDHTNTPRPTQIGRLFLLSSDRGERRGDPGAGTARHRFGDRPEAVLVSVAGHPEADTGIGPAGTGASGRGGQRRGWSGHSVGLLQSSHTCTTPS